MILFAHFEGHDGPGLTDELVLCDAAVIDGIVIRFEDAVRQPVALHNLPDVLGSIEFGAFRRKRHQHDVRRHDQFRRSISSGRDARGRSTRRAAVR